MLKLIVLGVVLVILSANGKPKKEDLRKVHLEGLGNVLGNKFWDGEFYEFFGIPYATAPKDRDRYKAPLPPRPWDEDMKANRGVLLCHQIYKSNSEDEGDILYGEEDCLAASFFVPKVASETNLVPVIVYVHSGAYVGGNGNMAKFHFLARQDVIVVNMNYRLGAIGFACLGTEEVPGNAGLKDIVAALKFIKKHVKSFGGDPDNITLAGYSIGASLAEIVALSPASKGLFSKLALDSGSALTPFAVNRHPIETARNLAVSVGYDGDGSIEDLNEFFVDADTEDIQGVARNYFLKNSTFGFTPCIENPNNPDAVLTESPLDTLKKGNYGDFTLYHGWANMEGISRTSQFDEWRDEMNTNFAEFLPADLHFENEKDKEAFIKEVKQFYFDGKAITVDSLRGFIDYFSDSMFRYAIVKSLKLHAQNLKRSIYAYEFTYVGKLNTQHNYMDRIQGASHRDASAYVLDFHDWTRNFTDMDMRDLMVYMWADFLKFENPTPYESSLLTMKWVKYTSKDQLYLDMGYDLVMKKNPFAKGFELWDKVYQKHYWNPTVVSPDVYEKTREKTEAKKHVKKIKPVKTKKEDTDEFEMPDGVPPEDTVPVENKPVESNPVENKPVESKPVATKPVETIPVENKPVDNKPVETKPFENKPVETKPVETKPVESKPIEAKPIESKPAVSQPVDAKPVETKTFGSKPIETIPVEPKPAVTKPVETKPVGSKPVEAKPVESQQVHAKPVETKTTGSKPVETKPVEPKPAVTKPVEIKPVESQQVHAKPVETKTVNSKPAEVKPVVPNPVEIKPKVELKDNKLEEKPAANTQKIAAEKPQVIVETPKNKEAK